MSKYFAAVAPRGWIWPETCRHQAGVARQALGKMFIGYRPGGRDTPPIETAEDGYAFAFKQGYRVVKVKLERLAP